MLRAVIRSMILAAFLLTGVGQAVGQEIDVKQIRLIGQPDGWYLDAEFGLELKPTLKDAVERGLSLYFVIEFELTRSRWYWFDEKSASSAIQYRLSYHALTRQYRLTTGVLQQGFDTLDEALGVMKRVRNWRVIEANALAPGESYQAAVRMRLDTGQLPKPFQITALTSTEWTLDSDWKFFPVTLDSQQ